jgi:hypothetical protein
LKVSFEQKYELKGGIRARFEEKQKHVINPTLLFGCLISTRTNVHLERHGSVTMHPDSQLHKRYEQRSMGRLKL